MNILISGMASIKYVLLGLLLVLPFVFADIGPAPPAPNVVVRIVDNGAPASEVSQITYHCMGSNDTNVSGPVEPAPIGLPCIDGVCRNDGGWYYKFNPCYDFPGGYFSYEFEGKTIKTENFEFAEKYSDYEMTIEAENGSIIKKTGSSLPSGCLPALLMPAILGLGLAFGTSKRG